MNLAVRRMYVYAVVQNFVWFKIFQTNLVFIFRCAVFITIIRDKGK